MDSPNKDFDFWVTRNPISPQPDLLPADDLFLNGVVLPLQLLHLHPNHQPDPKPEIIENTNTEPPPDLEQEPSKKPGLEQPDNTVSKRWKDIFKKGEKVNKTERKKSNPSTGTKLNINLWPFSRSRSAGTGATRPKILTRKVSSAPCSRSNSAGESKYRKWPASPGRVGVHLGRASPVWQVRRHAVVQGKRSDKKVVSGNGTGKARVLNLNVPMCIGHRQQQETVDDGKSGGNLFNLRGLFVKKVY